MTAESMIQEENVIVGQNIIEAYVILVEKQSNERNLPNQCYGEFSNSQSWKQFSNHNKPFSQSS